MPLDYIQPQPPHDRFLSKSLPSSEDSERAILGAILMDAKLIAQAAAALLPENFYSPFQRNIYAAMLRLFERGETVEPIAIGEELKKLGQFDSVGGVSAITNLTFGLPYTSNLSPLIKTIGDCAKIRELIKVCGEITATALEGAETNERILDFAQTKINEVCAPDAAEGFSSIGNLAVQSLQTKLELRKSDNRVTGLETGFTMLDVKTSGLQKTDLIIIAARPSLGKTALMLNITDSVCQINREAAVAVFSLEMSKEQLTDRMICSKTEIDSTRYRTGFFTDTEAERISRSIADFGNFKIEIDDRAAATANYIRAKSMWFLAKYKRLDLIVIDYLQLMSGTNRDESRQQEVGHISRDLKAIAKELKVPVVALSQLSRKCEERHDKRPILSDLRESGEIEQNADVVCFLYRDNYYNEKADPTTAELNIAKNRNGPTGKVDLTFMKEFTKFKNA